MIPTILSLKNGRAVIFGDYGLAGTTADLDYIVFENTKHDIAVAEPKPKIRVGRPRHVSYAHENEYEIECGHESQTYRVWDKSDPLRHELAITLNAGVYA